MGAPVNGVFLVGYVWVSTHPKKKLEDLAYLLMAVDDVYVCSLCPSVGFCRLRSNLRRRGKVRRCGRIRGLGAGKLKNT